ncbi:MAG: MoaD/ThiS family protein, partial [Bacteroidota bacterium]
MRVHYFGEIADIIGKNTDDLVLKNASVSELLSYLQSTHKLLVDDIHIAVNHQIVSKEKDTQLN